MTGLMRGEEILDILAHGLIVLLILACLLDGNYTSAIIISIVWPLYCVAMEKIGQATE